MTNQPPQEIERALKLFSRAEMAETPTGAASSFLQAIDVLEQYSAENPASAFEEEIQRIRLSNNRMLLREWLDKEPLKGTGILECLEKTDMETELNISQSPDLKKKYDMAMRFNSTEPAYASSRAQEDGTLYKQLLASNLSFIPTGEHHIATIYSAIQEQFKELCDDSLLCHDNCARGDNQPEWKHVARNVMQELKVRGKIKKGLSRGYWLIEQLPLPRTKIKNEGLDYRVNDKVLTRHEKTAKLLSVISQQCKDGKIEWEYSDNENVYRATFLGGSLSIGSDIDGSYFTCIEGVQGGEDTIHENDRILNKLLNVGAVMKEIFGRARTSIAQNKVVEQTIDDLLLELGEQDFVDAAGKTISHPRRNLGVFPEGLQDIFEVSQLVWEKNISYTDAVRSVANKRGVTEQTVSSSCTIRFGINTATFRDLLTTKIKLGQHLIATFPRYAALIYERFDTAFSVPTTKMPDEIVRERTKEDVGHRGEKDYVNRYRKQLANSNSLISRMLSYIQSMRRITREEMKSVCVEMLGCKSESSGSINACLKVLEIDGYIVVDGQSARSVIRITGKKYMR